MKGWPIDMQDLIKSARKLRTKLLADPYRPRYHFVAPEGVCRPFDPNGAIFWRNRYHLFYIFQDPCLPHGGHCWGHASSVDLLHWVHRPTALAPSIDSPEKGIFSGCALVSLEGVPTIVYLGIDSGICLATSEDEELLYWQKSRHNPVIPIPREGDSNHSRYIVHDPHVWLEGNTYFAILNGMGVWDTTFLFKSQDLIHWEYLHPFHKPKQGWSERDEDCACPDFFSLGNRYMLMCISHKRGGRYYLGRYENERFHPVRHVRMNWPGGTLFATESLLDGKGRRIFWAWVLDRRDPERAAASGWSGIMSLPRVLALKANGTVSIEPVEELSRIRFNHRSWRSINLASEAVLHLDEVHGDSFELDIEVKPQEALEIGLIVRRSPGGEEQTVITYNQKAKTLNVDFSRSTLDKSVKYPTVCIGFSENDPGISVQSAPFELHRGESLKLRVFVDRSILEVFANSRQCITQCIYPSRKDSLRTALFSRGGLAIVHKLDVWNMADTNPW